MDLNNLKIKSVVFDKENDITIICKNSTEIISYEDKNNILIKIASLLDGRHSLKNIYDNLISEQINIKYYDLKKIIINIFINNDLILGNYNNIILNDKQILKYNRLIHFFTSYKNVDFLRAQKMQKRLFDSNVLILGVGGTGGHTAHSLIASGIGNMTLLDFDNIELTNVTRQMLYTEKEIGLSKIEIAKKKLLEINPEAKINTINAKITNAKQIQNVVKKQHFDFIINTLDNPRGEIRYILDKALYDSNIPYIYNGSAGSNVFVGPTIHKGETKCYADLIKNSNGIDKLVSKVNDEIYITNVIEPLNGTVGQFTAFEVIKYLTKCAKLPTMGTRIKLNMDEMVIDKYEL